MKKSVSFSASGARLKHWLFVVIQIICNYGSLNHQCQKVFHMTVHVYGILSIIHHHILKINWIEHIWNSITLNRITQFSMYSLLQTQRPPFFFGLHFQPPRGPGFLREGSHGRRRWKSNGSLKGGLRGSLGCRRFGGGVGLRWWGRWTAEPMVINWGPLFWVWWYSKPSETRFIFGHL